MPLYEYQCEKCGEVFEVMQKFADEPLSKHEKCGGDVHRLLSVPALQFKGSGWYITDYAKRPDGSSNGSTKKGDSGSASGSESSEAAASSTGSSSEAKSGSSSDKK
jgi:putative FmdB family regulatory protein